MYFTATTLFLFPLLRILLAMERRDQSETGQGSGTGRVGVSGQAAIPSSRRSAFAPYSSHVQTEAIQPPSTQMHGHSETIHQQQLAPSSQNLAPPSAYHAQPSASLQHYGMPSASVISSSMGAMRPFNPYMQEGEESQQQTILQPARPTATRLSQALVTIPSAHRGGSSSAFAPFTPPTATHHGGIGPSEHAAQRTAPSRSLRRSNTMGSAGSAFAAPDPFPIQTLARSLSQMRIGGGSEVGVTASAHAPSSSSNIMQAPVPPPSTTLLGRRSAHADELEPTRSAAIRQRLASEMEEQQTQQQHVMPSSGGSSSRARAALGRSQTFGGSRPLLPRPPADTGTGDTNMPAAPSASFQRQASNAGNPNERATVSELERKMMHDEMNRVTSQIAELEERYRIAPSGRGPKGALSANITKSKRRLAEIQSRLAAGEATAESSQQQHDAGHRQSSRTSYSIQLGSLAQMPSAQMSPPSTQVSQAMPSATRVNPSQMPQQGSSTRAALGRSQTFGGSRPLLPRPPADTGTGDTNLPAAPSASFQRQASNAGNPNEQAALSPLERDIMQNEMNRVTSLLEDLEERRRNAPSSSGPGLASHISRNRNRLQALQAGLAAGIFTTGTRGERTASKTTFDIPTQRGGSTLHQLQLLPSASAAAAHAAQEAMPSAQMDRSVRQRTTAPSDTAAAIPPTRNVMPSESVRMPTAGGAIPTQQPTDTQLSLSLDPSRRLSRNEKGKATAESSQQQQRRRNLLNNAAHRQSTRTSYSMQLGSLAQMPSAQMLPPSAQVSQAMPSAQMSQVNPPEMSQQVELPAAQRTPSSQIHPHAIPDYIDDLRLAGYKNDEIADTLKIPVETVNDEITRRASTRQTDRGRSTTLQRTSPAHSTMAAQVVPAAAAASRPTTFSHGGDLHRPSAVRQTGVTFDLNASPAQSGSSSAGGSDRNSRGHQQLQPPHDDDASSALLRNPPPSSQLAPSPSQQLAFPSSSQPPPSPSQPAPSQLAPSPSQQASAQLAPSPSQQLASPPSQPPPSQLAPSPSQQASAQLAPSSSQRVQAQPVPSSSNPPVSPPSPQWGTREYIERELAKLTNTNVAAPSSSSGIRLHMPSEQRDQQPAAEPQYTLNPRQDELLRLWAAESARERAAGTGLGPRTAAGSSSHHAALPHQQYAQRQQQVSASTSSAGGITAPSSAAHQQTPAAVRRRAPSEQRAHLPGPSQSRSGGADPNGRQK